MPAQQKQLRRWSLTIQDNETFDLENNKDELRKKLSDILEAITKPKWIFQLERGAREKKLHFQGRLTTKNPTRPSELISKLPDYMKHAQFRIESKEEASTFYCMKTDETFVEGPWSDKDKPLYVPRQIREIIDLHPWQKQIIELAAVWDTRSIHVIFDTIGNNGKSTLCTYMGVNRTAKLLPFCNDYRDILRMTYDVGVFKCYLIDMPRAICKERLYQFYAAIETIKSGYAYDDRHVFKDRYFDCPNVIVFTNTLPDFNLLSLDRWHVWTIKDLQLTHYEPTC